MDDVSLVFSHRCEEQNANAEGGHDVGTLRQLLILGVKGNELDDSENERKVCNKHSLRARGSHGAERNGNAPKN